MTIARAGLLALVLAWPIPWPGALHHEIPVVVAQGRTARRTDVAGCCGRAD